MKILRIKVDGLPLYKEPFDVSFYSVQRVESSHLEALSNLFGNIYINTAEAFIGLNASGKTTALKVIFFVGCLLSAESLNSSDISNILGDDQKTVVDVDFFADGKIFHLNSEIVRKTKGDGKPSVQILSEQLWEKAATSRVNKKNLLDFAGIEPVRVRNNSDEYLPDDVSIMIAVNRQIRDEEIMVDLMAITDLNFLYPEKGTIPVEIISLLDPTIEHLLIENLNQKFVAHLKFFGQKEIAIYNPIELNSYLSSGTVKGIRVFSEAIRVLKNGGYLIVDEIENHFNRELVVALLRLFMNRKTNPQGARIIFSTHYPDLLDEIVRNDAVFITRSKQGLAVDNLNALLGRNDMKKSEVYQSDFLGGTAPKYSALLALQKSIIADLEA